jgi:hypothetical protein
MKNLASRLAFSAGFAAVVIAAADTSSAQPKAEGPCSSAPAAPKGHVLAKIDKVESNGTVTLALPSDATGSQKPKTGDDAYLLKCNGFRFGGAGDAKIASIAASSAQVVFAVQKNQLEGHYVAIDSGYDSQTPLAEGEVRPPAGYVAARIIDNKVDGRGAGIVIAAAYGQGVFPGAKGYIIDEKGKPIRDGSFVIDEANHPRQVRAKVDASVDGVNNSARRVFVEATSRKCTAPESGMPSSAEIARAVKSGAPPAGWIALDVPGSRPDWPKLKISAGTDRGVLPPGGAFLIGRGSVYPATLGDIRASSASVTAGGDNPGALKDTPLRLFVSTGKCN